MLWRWRWSYPVVVAILFVGSPAEPLDMVETARWEASDRRDNGTVRVAFVPDAGCLQIEDGKQIGYEFALLEAWEDAIPQRIEWLFARSAEEALAWVQVGRADVAAGNIPLLERVGFTTSAPVRTFEWVQWGASDSLRWLAEYPQTAGIPLAIGQPPLAHRIEHHVAAFGPHPKRLDPPPTSTCRA